MGCYPTWQGPTTARARRAHSRLPVASGPAGRAPHVCEIAISTRRTGVKSWPEEGLRSTKCCKDVGSIPIAWREEFTSRVPFMSSTLEATMPARPQAQPSVRRQSSSDIWIYLLITALVAGAWLLTRQRYFTAGDDVGYWLGVAGGVMMLMLFSYPLRKYVRPLHRLGKVKWWFLAHMVMGIGGPLLILIHSTFRVGSLNAAVALYSMLLVAGSGVVGRFIYLRVHRGLSGQKLSLQQLQSRAGLDESEARSRLHFAPEVEARLLAFSEAQLGAGAGWSAWLRQVFVLPVQMWLVYWHCVAELRQPLIQLARRRHWSAADLSRRRYLARKLVRRYLASVVRVAQFSAYERLFALWHVLHVPFIYILVISSVVHVIAVHAY